MNICILTSSYPAIQKNNVSSLHANAGIFVEELAYFLAKYNHHIYVVAPCFKGESNTVHQPLPNILIKKFKYWGYKSHKVISTQQQIPVIIGSFFLLNMLLTARKIIKKEKVDVIHCYWIIPSGFVGVLLKIFFKIPVIISSPGSDLNDWSYRKIAGFFIRKTLKNCEHLITLGSQLRQRAIEIGMNPEKTESILGDGGMNPDLFFPRQVDIELKKKLKIPDDYKVLIYVGRLTNPKRIDLVLPLIKEFKNLFLLIIGQG